MNVTNLDIVLIGGGHAGLSISYYLKKLHLNHIVFEKGKIGDSWRNQRWDTFRMNTSNKMNLLPGQGNNFTDAEGFCTASEFVSVLEEYSKRFNLPVIENCEVLSVDYASDSGMFSVLVSENGSARYYLCSQVVVASGGQNIKCIPDFAKNISPEIFQIHAGDYRNSSLLPDGAVIVIGSGQCGVQVAEDLISNGRKVFISTSKVGRIPRRYRGKDMVEWLNMTGFFDMLTTEVTDPAMFTERQPHISGVGERGHTISLQALARSGADIFGKVENADDDTVFLQPNAAMHVKYADEVSKKVKSKIDEYIQELQIEALPPEEDIADIPDDTAAFASSATSLNLRKNKITSIIWGTGFTGDFSYLKLPIFNDSGLLNHYNGISEIKGLYFIGLPWLRKRKSGIIAGIIDDAEFIAAALLANHEKG